MTIGGLLPTAASRVEAAFFLLAVAFGAAGALGPWDADTANVLFFGAWCAALLMVFSLGLRLPLRPRSPVARAAAATGAVAAAIGLAVIGNIALYRHDVHFDLTQTGRFTAPAELEAIAASLKNDVVLTYFYNAGDENARTAKDVLAGVGRRHRHLLVRAADLDKELRLARSYGVRLYNTAVVEAGGRRVQVENTVDLRRLAFAIQRALRERTETVCFVTGHGEPFRTAGRAQFGHVETLRGHEVPGAGDVIQAGPEGVDRLKLALEAIGYSARAVAPAMVSAIPDDCAAVADIGPRNPYAPVEAEVLERYLGRGGRLLLMFDPEFPVEPKLEALLAKVGLAVDSGTVVDPTNHYGTDDDKVAVPYYPPHPITEPIAMTVFPGARPVRLSAPVDGVTATELFATSKDGYVRRLEAAPADVGRTQRGPITLAAALQGRWPGAAEHEKPFRLVLVGNASFASNAFFPYVSNGNLAISMIRWLTADLDTPVLKPATYSLPEINLTHRQMQVTFIVLEVLLPSTVILLGGLVWWKRR